MITLEDLYGIISKENLILKAAKSVALKKSKLSKEELCKHLHENYKDDELAKTLLDSYNEEFNKANLTKNVQGNDIDILSVKKYMLDSYRKIDN